MSSKNITLTFESGVGTVTGANFLLKAHGKNILVDCGLIQGEKIAMMANREAFPYKPSDIDVLMVTHAHLDHVGRIPKLVKDGFTGVIYSTPETRSLADLILGDAVGLLAKEAREEGLEPLYEPSHVEAALSLWKTIPYHTTTEILPHVKVFLKDAGHILGSAMVEMSIQRQGDSDLTILFSGDLGNSPAPLLRDTEAISPVDYIVMESVYGNRNHEPHDLRREKLARIISETIARKGTVVIPAFSMERTQVLLYELNALVETGVIPSVPVFIDSPLATRITEVYRASPQLFNDTVKAELRKGDDVFDFPQLKFTASVEESKTIDHIHEPKIIVAGSGMSVGGRVGRHEALYLPDPNSTVLLVGYQTPGTIGRKLQDGVKKLEINRETVKVRARVDAILGYSAHKDSDHLVDFVVPAAESVKKVFVAMGETKASLFLVQKLRDNLSVNALHPEAHKEYIL